jgi:1-deoxy-D-xylulose-5-phosphate reductoisomerase
MGMKQLSILGSTGSIGRNVLNIVDMFPDKFGVKALAAKNNIELLLQQVQRFCPEIVSVFDEKTAVNLIKRLPPDSDVEIVYGDAGYRAVATCDSADVVFSAMMGASGLIPTLAAIDAGKTIALANKETLVMAGEIVMKRAAEKNVKILPVDSEHSAIFQCIAGNHRMDDVDKIILTGSGGPFLRRPADTIHCIKPDEALNHPNWQMGDKISIDSATLMNKGLEVIEAKHFFGVPLDRIDVLIHPQSIVHSMVSFNDGSVMAQMGIPDMKGAIAYALSYPDRLALKQPLPDFIGLGALTFEAPDLKRFPCLDLCFQAYNKGATYPAVLNAANEKAVEAFLTQRLSFLKIPVIIHKVMDAHQGIEHPGLSDIFYADTWARQQAEAFINDMS